MGTIDNVYLKLIGRQAPFRKLYLGGTFDCLHRGHIALFRNAGMIANRVVVSVNTDEFATRYKRRPLMSMEDRMAVLSECRLVDQVIVNTGKEDSKEAILSVGYVDAIGHGDDWVGSSLKKQMGLTDEWLIEHGIAMVYLPYTNGVSTTEIIQKRASLT